MGKKLDALMGRSSKSLRPLLNLALSRLVVLKSQRQARCTLSRSDVVQLLTLSQHERALLRVEKVIKEENMMDVYVMVEGYCFMILERIDLIEQHEIRECPEEVNEAVSCLIYAASRCGEFPELQEIRAIFTHRYGKEFAARAIELRNNCSVNRQMIVKLSPRQADLKSRLKMLNEIAAENNIVLHIQDITTTTTSGFDHDHDQKKEQVILDQRYNNNNNNQTTTTTEEELTDSMKRGRQYKDVAEAAQAAFESAAHAAAAARAAVELSQDKEKMVETTTTTTMTSKEQNEGLQLQQQKNGSNLDDEKEEEEAKKKDDKEVDLKQSSNEALNAKSESKRFLAWTKRVMWRSRPGQEEEEAAATTSSRP